MVFPNLHSKRPRWNIEQNQESGGKRALKTDNHAPHAHILNLAQGRYPGSQDDLPPSHACAQWPIGKSTLAYRCGGSTGIGVNASSPVSRLTERLAPFCTLKQA